MPSTGKPTPPTIILLVRHGRTRTTGRLLTGQAPGYHLDAKGRQQAREVAARIGRVKQIAAVYASSLERAQETAAPIAAMRRLAVEIEPGLSDGDFGTWTGLKLSAARKRPEWKVVQRYPSGFRFPGGESFVEMQTRMVSTLARLVGRHPGQTIVAVSHADPIKLAVGHALGSHLDLFQRIAVAPASITTIAYGVTGPVVLGVNWGDVASNLKS
jgi:probable phosphoglycerate mutase